MLCAKCRNDNPADASFCEGCGAKLELACPTCKTITSPGARFCKKCGTALAPPSPDSHPTSPAESPIRVTADAGSAAEAIDGERKTVTALFADIKGSMDLIEDLDPEEARAIVDPALKLMIDAAHRYDGYIVQSTGDGIFAIFGAPVAHEDHPQRALHAALRMQEDLKRYADKLREQGQPPLLVRVGVNTGEVVVRSIRTGDAHTEYTPIGHSMSLASRLQTLAAPGSAVIGQSVQKFVEGYFQLKALGASRIKGVSEPVNVYEVTGLGPLRTRLQRSAGRGYTKFVGREREMEALKHAAGLARDGRGQIAGAVAEAGTGKSRLFFEFKAIAQSGWMVLETSSVSHGKASAYLPVIDLLHGYFAIEAGDDARKRREKVTGRVLALERTLEDTLPYLFIETEGSKSYVAFEPLGVVLAVMPWNFPLWQVFRFAAPALMAGNVGVLKHSSSVPGSALVIEEIFTEAGFPKGAFRTLLIPSRQVQAVIEHRLVRAVTLTGSTPAGKAVAAQAGAVLKKTVLELGGSDPYVVLEDADLDHTVETCVNSRLINCGQSCISAKRFIVLEPILAVFTEKFVELMKTKKVGDPLIEETDIGPLARHDLRDDLHKQVRASIEQGAKLLLGGEVPPGKGAYYPPTVLADVKPGMPAYDDELFGPMAAIIRAKDEADAVRIANDTIFGLGAAVFTRNVERGERIAGELEAGSTFVNSLVASDPRLPFGGIKQSGYGRELGSYGIKEFVNAKTIYVKS